MTMPQQKLFVSSSLVERPSAKDWFKKFLGFVEEHLLGKHKRKKEQEELSPMEKIQNHCRTAGENITMQLF